MVPIGGPRRPIEGLAKRDKGRKKWEGHEGLRPHGGSSDTPGTLGGSGRKNSSDLEKSENGRKLEKLWIIVHEFGCQRDLGPSAHVGLPGVVVGPLKAHSFPRRVRWCRRKALVSVPRVVPNELREGKNGKEMKV